jgi:hypothetical protein
MDIPHPNRYNKTHMIDNEKEILICRIQLLPSK